MTSQILDSLFYVHDCVVIFWYPQQYVPILDCMVGTHCARGLGLCLRDLLHSWPLALPSGLAVLVTSVFLFGTYFVGLVLLVASGLPLGLASLVALSFALGTRFAHGLIFALETRQNHRHYLDHFLSTLHSSLIK